MGRREDVGMNGLRKRGIGRWRHLKRSSEGISLLETVVALGILGLVGVAFMGALTTTFTATEISSKKVTAENLIRTQLEYVRQQSYVTPTDPLPYSIQTGHAYELPSSILLPQGYTIALEIDLFNDGTTDLPIAEIQIVTAKVFRDGRLVSKVSDLKTNR